MRVVTASLGGLALLIAPFVGLGPPGVVVAAGVVAGTVLAVGLLEAGARRLDTRLLALLAALAAIDAALRLILVNGIGGFSPVFFLVLCAGYVFGSSFGFLAGATALLVSALATGGLGPWLPYQMFGAGWVGVAAGLAGNFTRRTWALAVVGAMAGFGFGAVMDVWDWSFFRGSPQLGWTPGLAPAEMVARFARYYLVTSLGYDAFRAAGNVLMVLLLGPAVLAALRRMKARLTLEIVPAGIPEAGRRVPSRIWPG